MCILHLHMFHWFNGYFCWFSIRFFLFFFNHQKDIVVFNRASGLSDVTNQKQEFKYQTSLCKYQGLKVRVKRSYSTILYIYSFRRSQCSYLKCAISYQDDFFCGTVFYLGNPIFSYYFRFLGISDIIYMDMYTPWQLTVL